MSANELKTKGMICPVCGKSLTVGVVTRVERLSSWDVETESKEDEYGVRFIMDKEGKRRPYVMMVPLAEIVAETLGVGVGTKGVAALYERMVENLGSEFKVLLETPLEDIKKIGGEKLAEGIKKVRKGDIHIKPGYDGVFGRVSIWDEIGKKKGESQKAIDQASLF
jgi:PHP family Zn ribbon phosphoesterase